MSTEAHHTMMKKVSIPLFMLLALALPVLVAGCGGHEAPSPHKQQHQRTETASSVPTVPVRTYTDARGYEFLLVPQAALFTKGALTGVLVVDEDGMVVTRWIRPGKRVGRDIAVLSGVEPGEQVVGSYDPELHEGVFIKQNQVAAEEVQSNE